jgi:hypothetical protein
MDDNTKAVVAVGSGILIGKLGGSIGWWLIGGATAFLILKSPTAREAVSKGAKKAYEAVRG